MADELERNLERTEPASHLPVGAALEHSLRAVTETIEKRLREFEPSRASDGEKAILEDLAVSMEELRVLSEALQDRKRLLERVRCEVLEARGIHEPPPLLYTSSQTETVLRKARTPKPEAEYKSACKIATSLQVECRRRSAVTCGRKQSRT